jgi:hypothetical protein
MIRGLVYTVPALFVAWFVVLPLVVGGLVVRRLRRRSR